MWPISVDVWYILIWGFYLPMGTKSATACMLVRYRLVELVKEHDGFGKRPASLNFFIGCLAITILSNPVKNLLTNTLYFSIPPTRTSCVPAATARTIYYTQFAGNIQ